jgi:hypothetical protein
VTALQRALAKLGYPLDDDGEFGKKTLKAVQKHARDRTRKGAPAWQVAAIHAEAGTGLGEGQTATTGIESVGAWCGSSSLANPVRDVAFAVEHGLDRLDVIVNDHSKWREPSRFTIRTPDRIHRLCDAAKEAGVEVHLTSWIMPHADYIDRAADVLIPLCERVGAASLQWDAEEPWTRARRRLTYSKAAARIREAFADLRCPMGANGIGYTPRAKFGPLAEICDYLVPQAYATSTSGIKPEVAPGRFHRRWTEKFARPIVMGLAAYRQTGIAGHTPSSAIEAAVEATSALLDVHTILYWSLAAIRRSPNVARAIAGIREAGIG